MKFTREVRGSKDERRSKLFQIPSALLATTHEPSWNFTNFSNSKVHILRAFKMLMSRRSTFLVEQSYIFWYIKNFSNHGLEEYWILHHRLSRQLCSSVENKILIGVVRHRCSWVTWKVISSKWVCCYLSLWTILSIYFSPLRDRLECASACYWFCDWKFMWKFSNRK